MLQLRRSDFAGKRQCDVTRGYSIGRHMVTFTFYTGLFGHCVDGGILRGVGDQGLEDAGKHLLDSRKKGGNGDQIGDGELGLMEKGCSEVNAGCGRSKGRSPGCSQMAGGQEDTKFKSSDMSGEPALYTERFGPIQGFDRDLHKRRPPARKPKPLRSLRLGKMIVKIICQKLLSKCVVTEISEWRHY
jgi:hypothetical protein